jgi:hypothetical protein
MPQGHSHETTELKLLFLNEGYAAGAANRGRLFLGYLLFATQKKVTSSRSATGEFGFKAFANELVND